MRVLLLTADYPPDAWSGVGVAVERQARALAALGVETHVLVGRAPDSHSTAPSAPLSPSNVAGRGGPGEGGPDDQRPLPLVEGWGEGLGSHRGPIVHSLSQERCPVDPGDFDIIHLHSLALSELALEMRRRSGARLVYTAHALLQRELEAGPQADFWRAVQVCVMTASDAIVWLSEAERVAALEWLPNLASRSHVAPHGVATPAPRATPPADGPVVFAGRFARTKGIDLLAEIMPCVLRQRRTRFVMAGGHGDREGTATVAALAQRFGDACLTPGWLTQAQLADLFAEASLVLMPSRYEPFGLVALEAMSVGAPVLAAAVGGLAEVVGPGSGGRLIENHDPDTWMEAILDILDTPGVGERLRRQGPTFVKARYDPLRLARRLVDEVYAA